MDTSNFQNFFTQSHHLNNNGVRSKRAFRTPKSIEMKKMFQNKAAFSFPETTESNRVFRAPKSKLKQRITQESIKRSQKNMLNIPETVIINSDQFDNLVKGSEFPETIEMTQGPQPMELSPEEIEMGQKPITFILPKRNLSKLNLNVNTAIIKNQINIDKSKYNNPKFSLRQKSKELMQNGSERRIVSGSHVCPNKILVNLQDRLGNINYKKLKETVRKNFYDPAVIEVAMCTTESIFYLSPGAIKPRQRIKNWILNLRELGISSVQGVAMRADLEKENDFFIVKAPRNPGKTDEIMHELFVTTRGTNNLRKLIPNFAYVYGGVSCSLPALSINGKVGAWCNLKHVQSVDYIIYENIDPSIPMKDYVSAENCNFTDWLGYYLQILYSLRYAKAEIDFTHYDLHYNNVLLRDVILNRKSQDKFLIPYHDPKSNIVTYVKTNKVATLIDFGFSHIKYQGKNYGKFGLRSYGVSPNRSYLLSDAYKLLGFCMRALIGTPDFNSETNECFIGMSNIFKFFNPIDDPVKAIMEEVDIYHYLPWFDKFEEFDIDSLLDYITLLPALKIFTDKILIKSNGINKSLDKVLGCTGKGDFGVCMKENQVFKSITKSLGNPIFNDVFEFTDVISRLEETKNINIYLKQYDHESGLKKATDKLDSLYKTLRKNMKIKFLSFENDSFGQLEKQTSRNQRHLNSIVEVLHNMETWQEILTLEQSIFFVAGKYGKNLTATQEIGRIQKKNGLSRKIILKYFYKIYNKESTQIFKIKNTVSDSNQRTKIKSSKSLITQLLNWVDLYDRYLDILEAFLEQVSKS